VDELLDIRVAAVVDIGSLALPDDAALVLFLGGCAERDSGSPRICARSTAPAIRETTRMSSASFNFTAAPSFNTTATAPTPFGPPPKFVKLGNHLVGQEPPKETRAAKVRTRNTGAKQTGKWLSDMTDEERRAFLKRNGVKTVEPTSPDPNPVPSQATRNLPGMFNPFPSINELYQAAVQIGVVQPRWPSMRDFDAAAAASNFLCARAGEACVARPGESLKGKTFVMGYMLDDKDDISACRDLVARHIRPGDRVLCGVGRTELQNPAVRDGACFGAPEEQCVAVSESAISARTGEAMNNLAKLALERLRLIDPEYASELEETHRSLNTEATARLREYQDAASYLSNVAPRENRRAVERLNREIDEASKELLSISKEETPARAALYAEQIRTLSDGERAIYVAAPMAIADRLQAEFLDNPDVVVICPRNSAERWSRAMGDRL
jgi:hypothetical protein